MVGDAVTWTVNWHHNGNQKRAKHPLYTSNDPQFIVIDARDGNDSGSVHVPSYTTMRRIIESETEKLKNSLRVGGDLLLKYLSEDSKSHHHLCGGSEWSIKCTIHRRESARNLEDTTRDEQEDQPQAFESRRSPKEVQLPKALPNLRGR